MLFLQLCHGIHFTLSAIFVFNLTVLRNYQILDADICVMKNKTPADKNHLFCQLCGFYQ